VPVQGPPSERVLCVEPNPAAASVAPAQATARQMPCCSILRAAGTAKGIMLLCFAPREAALMWRVAGVEAASGRLPGTALATQQQDRLLWQDCRA
jgi:hypothetical protein